MVKDETRLTRLFELQDAVEQARLELSAMTPDAEETQGVAFATVSHMTDRCECLHMELNRSRVFQKGDTEGTARESESLGVAVWLGMVGCCEVKLLPQRIKEFSPTTRRPTTYGKTGHFSILFQQCQAVFLWFLRSSVVVSCGCYWWDLRLHAYGW